MTVHILQHVSFEGPGYIADWARDSGFRLTFTHLYENESFPNPDDFGMLVIMGGPMNIYDEAKFPWLADEKRFIRQAIDAGKPVLGICLGSQLIADVIGGKVSRNKEVEIGWMPVRKTPQGYSNALTKNLEFDSPVFHWHGDTFELPQGAQNLFESDGCKNQMFAYGSNVVGIQFHPEATPEAIAQMITHGRDELRPSLYVQSEKEICARHFSGPNLVLATLLDRLSFTI